MKKLQRLDTEKQNSTSSAVAVVTVHQQVAGLSLSWELFAHK